MCDVVERPAVAAVPGPRCGRSQQKKPAVREPTSTEICAQIEQHLSTWFDKILECRERDMEDKDVLCSRFEVDLNMLAMCDPVDLDLYAKPCRNTRDLQEHLRRQLLLGIVLEYHDFEIQRLQTTEILPPRNPEIDFTRGYLCSMTSEDLQRVADSRVLFAEIHVFDRSVLVELDLLWATASANCHLPWAQARLKRCRDLYAQQIEQSKKEMVVQLQKLLHAGRCTKALRDVVLRYHRIV